MIKTVDARGLQCPQPVINTKNALKEISEGTLEVLVDNEIAVQNLTKFGNFSKLETVSKKLEDGQYKVIYTISHQVAQNEELQKSEVGDGDSRINGQVVVIASDHMGEGNAVLGKILIKGFIYALTQLDRLPETMIFYNGGAALTTIDSESLEDLKLLEAEGVEIMTCGTCLNHYGLGEKLAVGSVTNMYVIAEKMTEAVSVIKP